MSTFHILFSNLLSDKDSCLSTSQKYESKCQHILKKVIPGTPGYIWQIGHTPNSILLSDNHDIKSIFKGIIPLKKKQNGKGHCVNKI